MRFRGVMDSIMVFGFTTLNLANCEKPSIYKHFVKLQKLIISIWHLKGTHFLGAYCNISLHSERDITKRFERFIEGSNPSAETKIKD